MSITRLHQRGSQVDPQEVCLEMSSVAWGSLERDDRGYYFLADKKTGDRFGIQFEANELELLRAT